jgi:hypothetical protein
MVLRGRLRFNDALASGKIRQSTCWAYVRRKFYDLHLALDSPIADEALCWIGQLYDIERSIRGQPPPARQAVREEHVRPILDAFRVWLDAQLCRVPHAQNWPQPFGTL